MNIRRCELNDADNMLKNIIYRYQLINYKITWYLF